MSRFPSSGALDASPGRRDLLIGAAGLMLAGCGRQAPMTVSRTPKLKMQQLNDEVGAIADRVRPALLGAGLLNLDSGQVWTLNGEKWFPMQSVFKAPLAAAVLSEADAGRLSLDERITLRDIDLSPLYSPIAEAFPARRDYSLRDFLASMVVTSDNTAADLLMRRIGGPGAVTAWLTGKDIAEVRVDRYERDLQPESVGLEPFRPIWKDRASYRRAVASVPPVQRRAAEIRYMADPRDSATPRGMLQFLELLDSRQLISPASTTLLEQLMIATAPGIGRLKAGLPKGATLAHRTGTGATDQGLSLAVNDVGVIVLPDKRRYAAAVFLRGSTLGADASDAVIAEVARAMVRGAR
jgi:beta-lactamase class A